MRRARFHAAAGMGILMAGAPAAAGDFSLVAPEPAGGKPQVVNGTPQDPSAWPASFILKVAGGGCTATVVGPKTILTAAHCLKSSLKGRINTPGGAATEVACTIHPEYTPTDTDPKTSVDFALCATMNPINVAAYERIGTDRAATVKGTNVVLLGYGCTQQGGVDFGFGVLHRGDAQIDRVGIGADIYLTTFGANAVCYGDSGGAGYYYTDRSKTRRVIIGVNSRGNIKDTSYISSTATDAFVEWTFAWAAENDNALICGLHAAAPNCRTS